MASRIQFRRGTAVEWSTANPILAEGELGVELDTSKCKVGDGILNWNSLLYAIGATGPAGANGINGTNGVDGIDGINGADGAPGPIGPVGGTATVISRLNLIGPLTPITGTSRWYPSSTIMINSLSINVGVSSTSTIQVGVRKNGQLLQTITLQPNTYRSIISAGLSYTLSVNDYLTVDVISASGGSNLTLVMEYTPYTSTVLFTSRMNYIGILSPTIGTSRWYAGRVATITQVRCTVGTPSSSSIYVDILLNGLVILNLSIDADSYISPVLSNINIVLTPSDYLTADIINASNGRDLSVAISYL